MVSRGVSPLKIGPLPPLWIALVHMMTLEPPLPLNLFSPPSLINLTMRRLHK